MELKRTELCPHRGSTCFNRTFMELKRLSVDPLLIMLRNSFNRTFMELKHSRIDIYLLQD